MTQTFRAILAEKDQEFVYHIKSTRPLHDDDVFGNLQISLLGYDLRSLERMSYNPLAVNPMFGPNSDTPDNIFHVKVLLGTEVDNGELRQKIAYFTNIHWKYLVVHKDGEKMEDADMEDVDPAMTGGTYKTLAMNAAKWNATTDAVDNDTQQHVGHERIASFMKELEADRKDREALTIDREVEPNLFEAFVTSHNALRDVFGNTAPKGFYLIERTEDDQSILNIQGPFTKQPTNYPFIANMKPRGVGVFEVVSESIVRLVEHDRGFRFTRPLHEQLTLEPYEISVQDQDTGAVYDVLVKGLSEADARERGVLIVAQQELLDQTRLATIHQ
jgi:hypothetical protein